uniref:Component of oligomeric Golgi complex 6 n=1 Tax=Caenorhabditis tropicalis TaxID=1561998 RepID=A0A1I7SZY4_9PELO
MATENLKTVMENEKNDMDRLYSEHKKLFLLDIKDAVDDISAECDRLIYVLKNDSSNDNRIKECVSALSRVSLEIPTLAELRKRYEESIR